MGFLVAGVKVEEGINKGERGYRLMRRYEEREEENKDGLVVEE